MKHYERLNLLETEVMHMRENLAIFKSVMEAHMNDFAKSQTDEGLALWRTLQLMEMNTEQTYKLFYELFDAIKKDSQEQETRQTNFYPGWNVMFPDTSQLSPLTSVKIEPLSVWPHIVDSIQKVTL